MECPWVGVLGRTAKETASHSGRLGRLTQILPPPAPKPLSLNLSRVRPGQERGRGQTTPFIPKLEDKSWVGRTMGILLHLRGAGRRRSELEMEGGGDSREYAKVVDVTCLCPLKYPLLSLEQP